MSFDDCLGRQPVNLPRTPRFFIFRIIVFVETCATVAIACGMWSYIILIAPSANALQQSLVTASAILFSASFAFCVARSASNRCKFVPIVLCFIQCFAYLACGSVGISITQLFTGMLYYYVFAIYAFVCAIWMIILIIFPLNTDKNCIQLCCAMYDREPQVLASNVVDNPAEANMSLKNLVAQTNQRSVKYAQPETYAPVPQVAAPFGSPSVKYRYVGQ